MTTADLIREVFSQVEETMKPVPTHPQASVWPSAVVPREIA